MASQVLCGNCGSPLPHPSAACPSCGAAPTGRSRGAVPVSRKSPALAAALAIIPGLGHVYVGQYLKGAFFLAGAGGLEFFGFDADLTVVGAALGIPLGVGGIGLYAYQMWDAYREAKRINAELGYTNP
jgi:hypothetical protein